MGIGVRFAQALGMAQGGSLIDTDPVVKANTRDALHVMRVREESARANRRRLKRVITIVGASLIVSFFAWRVLVLY